MLEIEYGENSFRLINQGGWLDNNNRLCRKEPKQLTKCNNEVSYAYLRIVEKILAEEK